MISQFEQKRANLSDQARREDTSERCAVHERDTAKSAAILIAIFLDCVRFQRHNVN